MLLTVIAVIVTILVFWIIIKGVDVRLSLLAGGLVLALASGKLQAFPETISLGNLAWIGGALGRSMSPVSAAGIIAAGFAGMSPFELAKRNAVPMIVTAIAVVLILGR